MKNSDTHPPVPDYVDAAFSLLAGDAEVAERLRDILVTKMRVFLWSDAQKDIAGKNGVAVFTELYEKRASLVVVLYRAGYGQTNWTRVEETAITSKLVHSGWKHVLIVSLDGTKPSWAPASQLWFGLKQFGEEALADVIAARFHDLGSAPQPETIIERAGRVGTDREARKAAERWRNSDQGVLEAQAEVERLWKLLAQKVSGINAAQSAIRIDLRTSPDQVRHLRVDSAWTTMSWWLRYANVLSGSRLYVAEYAISKSSRSFVDPETQPPLAETYFLPFLDWRTNEIVWRERDGSDPDVATDPGHSTERLVDVLLGQLMDRDGGVE
jgi:hypothetical protein